MSDAVTITYPLEWRADGYGRTDQALYFGPAFIGSIMRSVPENWREFTKEPAEGEPPGVNTVGNYYLRYEATPWRAWFMSDDEGDEVGMYATADEARAAVVGKFLFAISPRPLSSAGGSR